MYIFFSEVFVEIFCPFVNWIVFLSFLFFFFFFNLLLPVLGLCCCLSPSLVSTSEGYASLQCMGLSLCALAVGRLSFSGCGSQALEHPLNSCGAWVWLLCSMWDLPYQGLNLCLLRWQVYSSPLTHQGSPQICVLKIFHLFSGLSFHSLCLPPMMKLSLSIFVFHVLCFWCCF